MEYNKYNQSNNNIKKEKNLSLSNSSSPLSHCYSNISYENKENNNYLSSSVSSLTSLSLLAENDDSLQSKETISLNKKINIIKSNNIKNKQYIHNKSKTIDKTTEKKDKNYYNILNSNSNELTLPIDTCNSKDEIESNFLPAYNKDKNSTKPSLLNAPNLNSINDSKINTINNNLSHSKQTNNNSQVYINKKNNNIEKNFNLNSYNNNNNNNFENNSNYNTYMNINNNIQEQYLQNKNIIQNSSQIVDNIQSQNYLEEPIPKKYFDNRNMNKNNNQDDFNQWNNVSISNPQSGVNSSYFLKKIPNDPKNEYNKVNNFKNIKKKK